MNLSQLKVLFFNSIEIPTKSDIVWGLVEIGTQVEYAETMVSLNEAPDDIVEAAVKELRNCDVAVTQNFSVSLAKACHETKIPYISWIYDSPQMALFEEEALYEENYVFAFDKKQVETLRNAGLKHVFYRPLAANMMLAAGIQISDEDVKKYKADISFIGQLYNSESRDNLLDKMSGDDKTLVETTVSEMSCIWESGMDISGRIPDTFAEKYGQYVLINGQNNLKTRTQLMLETILLGYGLAREERREVLSLLGGKYDFQLYTKDSDMEFAENFMPANKIHGYVKDEEPYKIFYSSKLNLNLSLRSIERGVPQRVFDIMAVGGTVISNYQAEIGELFVLDKEIVVFHSIEELEEKTAYLLAHDKERMQIGINGYKRVKNEFSYSVALMDMFDKL